MMFLWRCCVCCPGALCRVVYGPWGIDLVYCHQHTLSLCVNSYTCKLLMMMMMMMMSVLTRVIVVGKWWWCVIGVVVVVVSLRPSSVSISLLLALALAPSPCPSPCLHHASRLVLFIRLLNPLFLLGAIWDRIWDGMMSLLAWFHLACSVLSFSFLCLSLCCLLVYVSVCLFVPPVSAIYPLYLAYPLY